MSYSGLGLMAGGPIGGRTQESSRYKIDCRWSSNYLCKRIDELHNHFSNLNPRYHACTSLDYNLLLKNSPPAVIYLDPPYFNKGTDLYYYNFSLADHQRLADDLGKLQQHWLLSYDDCPEIRKLYEWAHIETVGVNYTIKSSRNKSELLIWNE
jgi:DNA adenine methylase